MMPVKPPAANANRITAGSQNRRRMCLRSPGGALTIAPGVYDFKRFIGGFAAIVPPESSRSTMLYDANYGQRGFPQWCTNHPFCRLNYTVRGREPRSVRTILRRRQQPARERFRFE